jgi:hypothetical protein
VTAQRLLSQQAELSVTWMLWLACCASAVVMHNYATLMTRVLARWASA